MAACKWGLRIGSARCGSVCPGRDWESLGSLLRMDTKLPFFLSLSPISCTSSGGAVVSPIVFAKMTYPDPWLRESIFAEESNPSSFWFLQVEFLGALIALPENWKRDLAIQLIFLMTEPIDAGAFCKKRLIPSL